MHRRIFYFLLFLALCPVLLTAGTKGRIKGKVVDLQTGEALIGANVLVIGTTTGAATDASGDFLLQNLDAGVYQVRASYLGYQSITISNVRVNADLTAYIDFELPSEDIQVGTVEIVAQKPLIQKDNTNAVRITSSEDIEALPVRGVNNIISLTAGITNFNGNIYIRGGRQDEVGYYLEGTSITNPMTGGRAVTISQDALEEIQVQAGGYTAEFGGANAGIVRTSLKSGGNNIKASFEYITDNVTFKGRDDAYNGEKRLGAYWYGYNEMSAVISGPLFGDKVKFFLNTNYLYQRDDNQQEWSGLNLGWVKNTEGARDSVYINYPAGARPENQSNQYNFVGTITGDITPSMKLRFSGVYTFRESDAGAAGITRIENDRVGRTDATNGTFNLKFTHVLSPTMFYEISGGYFLQTSETYDRFLKDDYWSYGDSVANANAGIVWERTPKDINNQNVGRYRVPLNKSVFGYTFQAPNSLPVDYAKFDRRSFNIGAALSLLIGKTHSIKIGGDYQKYTLRRWGIVGQDDFAFDLSVLKVAAPTKSEEQIKKEILMSSGVNNFGYDVLGNELDDDDYFGPREPVFASFYMQDKIEYEDIILNLGLRYDYISLNSKMYKNPGRPDLAINPTTFAILPDGWVDVPSFSAISPRIGFSFPVTNNTVFHAQWGKFVQQSQLNDVFRGYYRYFYETQANFFFGDPGGQNVRPTRTTQYEIGFSQQLADFLSFDVTGFYKDIKDQVIFEIQTADKNAKAQSYNILSNGDFATTKGIELSITMRRYERVSAQANISFQDARGTGSFPNSNRGIVGAPDQGIIFTPVYITPLEFNNGLRTNFNIDYRFGPNDGPSVLHDLGASLLIQYNSGHPFTLGTGKSNDIGYSGQTDSDARTRRPAEPLNSSVTPSNFQVDLRIDKTIRFFDLINANIYLYVINLFNNRNVQQVYLKTGSAETDGFLQNPSESAKIIQQYGEQYPAFYQGVELGYDGLYGPARQVRLGIRLEY